MLITRKKEKKTQETKNTNKQKNPVKAPERNQG